LDRFFLFVFGINMGVVIYFLVAFMFSHHWFNLLLIPLNFGVAMLVLDAKLDEEDC